MGACCVDSVDGIIRILETLQEKIETNGDATGYQGCEWLLVRWCR